MQTKPPHDPLLTPQQVADRLKVEPKTLEVWRSTGRYSIPFRKVGRLVRYRESDIDRIAMEGTGPAHPYVPKNPRGPRKPRPTP